MIGEQLDPPTQNTWLYNRMRWYNRQNKPHQFEKVPPMGCTSRGDQMRTLVYLSPPLKGFTSAQNSALSTAGVYRSQSQQSLFGCACVISVFYRARTGYIGAPLLSDCDYNSHPEGPRAFLWSLGQPCFSKQLRLSKKRYCPHDLWFFSRIVWQTKRRGESRILCSCTPPFQGKVRYFQEIHLWRSTPTKILRHLISLASRIRRDMHTLGHLVNLNHADQTC